MKTHTMPSSEKTQDSAAANAGKKRVLIVEDEHPLAHALELKFTHEGFACTVTSNGEEGLKAANAGDYDIILLDLIMPQMDGFTFLQQMKKKIPVIVLSNLGQEEDKKRASELGAKKYLVKSNTPITDIVSAAKECM